ncbi:tetratricopeptide repeat protein [Thermodesulfobacteriota bacterium]
MRCTNSLRVDGTRQRECAMILVAVVTFMCFMPCLHNGILRYDDEAYLLKSPFVLDASWRGLVETFAQPHLSNYQPLMLIVFRLLSDVFGFNPMLFHLVPVLLHVLNACLLSHILLQLGIRPWVAAPVTLIFSIHPLRVESVAWIYAGFGYTGASFFFLVAVSLYLKKNSENRPTGMEKWLIPVVFALGLMWKIHVVVLPAALLAIDFFLKRPAHSVLITEKTALFVLALLFVWVGLSAQLSGGAMEVGSRFLWWERPLNAAMALSYYALKTIWPTGLSVVVPYPTLEQTLRPSSYLPAFALLSMGALSLARMRRDRSLAFGLVWFLVCLLPALRLVPLGHSLVGDRYTYLAAAGLSVGVGGTLQSLQGSILKRAVFVALWLALVPLGVLSWKHSQVWKNDISLWNHAVTVVPESVMLHINLGLAYSEGGLIEEAEAALRTAQRLDPELTDTDVDLAFAKVYGQKGNFKEAIRYLNRALEREPDNMHAHVLLGVAWFGMEDVEAARRSFEMVRFLGGEVPSQFREVLSQQPDANDAEQVRDGSLSDDL